MFRLLITYHVSVEGVDERMKNVHHYHEGGREERAQGQSNCGEEATKPERACFPLQLFVDTECANHVAELTTVGCKGRLFWE